jgi:hypothetical protein
VRQIGLRRLAHWPEQARRCLLHKRCGAPRCMRSRGPALHVRSACGRVAPTARSTIRAADRLRAASRGCRVAPTPARRRQVSLAGPPTASAAAGPSDPSPPRSPAAPPPGLRPMVRRWCRRAPRSCRAPSVRRSPATPPSEVALRWVRWSCSVLPGVSGRCAGGAVSRPSRRRVAPVTVVPLRARRPLLRPVVVAVSRSVAVRVSPGGRTVLRRPASLLAGPLGPPVSRSPAVRSLLRLARRLALRWGSSTPVSSRGTRGFDEVS